MNTEIYRRYRATRQNLQSATPVTLLHIGEQETAVATGAGVEAEQILILPIGSGRTAAEFFIHTPPTPGEIENAIVKVEDEITRAREMIVGYPTLVTSDTSVREIAQIANGQKWSTQQISIEAVEQVFELLARHSQGRPASIAGIPDSLAFAASLLILREFMHHLKFTSIRVAEVD
jgi:exopolyphosphatase/pppGpp-phosphohydrolase